MTFRACSSASGLLSAFAISRSCFCISGSRAAAMASNVMSVSFRVVMSVLCFVDYDKNGQTQKGRTYTNFRLSPFWGCGQGFPLAILRPPGRPHGAGLRRSRSALAPGCHGVPAGPSGRLREGEECSGHYHPLPHSVTCHVWPLTLPVRSRPLSKQTGTAQSRCSTRASAERERRRPPIGVWWGVVIARTFPHA